jgi:molecular chaperone DnaJ
MTLEEAFHGKTVVINYYLDTACETKRQTVNIPASIEDGIRIRLAGEGDTGNGDGRRGDLYIHVTVAQHKIFLRNGANIHVRVLLPMSTATLGGTIEALTIDGSRVRVTVPAGTQSGHQFRLKGKGMTVLRSRMRGDMYIEANVETPVNLTERQKN